MKAATKMTIKKKITFIITRDIFYRNYVSEEGYKILKRSFKVNHALLPESQDPLDVADLKLNLISWNLKLQTFLIDLALIRYQSRSKSFGFRVKRRLWPRTSRIKSFRTFLKYFYLHGRLLSLRFFASNRLIYKLTVLAINLLFKRDKVTEEKLLNANSDLFLLPTNGAHPSEWELERIMVKENHSYISLVDNWDNFSSKTVLFYKANHYCVWGPQSKIHGWEIQDLDLDSISYIGTPRFETYRDPQIPSIKSNNEDYVLFVGTTVSFDEFKVLKLLDKIITNNNLKIKVIYRPHPWRESTEFPDIDTLKNIYLDEQLKIQYESGSSSPTFQPNLNYYGPLISNSKFVIGGLTSMLIEAQLLKKRFIGLAHNDPTSWVNPLDTLKGYTHFREISNLKNIELIYNLNALEETFVTMCKSDTPFKEDPFLNYFISFDDVSYWKKLELVILQNI